MAIIGAPVGWVITYPLLYEMGMTWDSKFINHELNSKLEWVKVERPVLDEKGQYLFNFMRKYQPSLINRTD